MMFSVQQGHYLSDAGTLNLKKKRKTKKRGKKKKTSDIARCAAVSASDLSVRGHRWYMAGI